MAELTDPKALFQSIIDALRREDGAAVLALAPEALALSSDNKSLRARVLAWLGQAEMYCGNYKAAGQAVRQSIALATELGDKDDVLQLKALQAQITTRRQAAAGMMASPLPIDLPDTPVARANALIGMGDHLTGEMLARDAREKARVGGDAREEVMALLAIARIPGKAPEAILEAAAVADASDDMNLVTAVAQAAKAAGVEIPPKVF